MTITLVAGLAIGAGCVGRAVLISHGAGLEEPIVALICIALCYALRRRVAARLRFLEGALRDEEG